MAHHAVLSPKLYAVIFVALLGLTGLTVFMANAPLGALHVPVALAIAGTKTFLVIYFFMHGMYSGRLIWLIIAGGLLFLAIMMGLIWTDYASRGGPWLPERSVPPPLRTHPE